MSDGNWTASRAGAASAGAEVPCRRNATRAADHASTDLVVRDAIERLATVSDAQALDPLEDWTRAGKIAQLLSLDGEVTNAHG